MVVHTHCSVIYLSTHRALSIIIWKTGIELVCWSEKTIWNFSCDLWALKASLCSCYPSLCAFFLKHCWKYLNFPLRKWINNSHQLALQSSSAGRLKSCLSFTSILHTQCLEFWVCARWNQFSSFNAAECVYLFNFQHYFILARCYFSFTLFLLKFDNGKLIACMFRKKLNSSDLFIYSITKFTIPTNALRTFS